MALGRLIAKWKRLYLKHKPLELQVDAARKSVAAAIAADGGKPFVSKLGTFALQTRNTVDWERMARDLIHPKVIDGLVAQYTTTSDPFVAAPRDWSAEAKG